MTCSLPISVGLLFLVCLLTPAYGQGASRLSAQTDSQRFEYQARLGPLLAGTMRFDHWQYGDQYELLGQYTTSQALSRYYTWNGTFAASGLWRTGGARTLGYWVRSESSDEALKIIVMGRRDTRRLEGVKAEFETLDRPQGTDLISALLFVQGCFGGGHVHDGEDAYPIALIEERPGRLSSREGFYSGPVTLCAYRFSDRKGNSRRIDVSMAQINGRSVAAEVRIKVRWFPDPTFRLRQ